MKVVNKSQQVVTSGLSPISAYSRVISAGLEVPADGAWHFAATPKLGQRFWLLAVQVWCFPRPYGPPQATEFEVRTGQETPPPAGDIENWENILPLHFPDGTMSSWSLDTGRDYISWGMKKLYKTVPRRLGIRARRADGFDDDGLWVSFEISEG